MDVDEQNVNEFDDDDANDDVAIVEVGQGGRVDSLINSILSWRRPSVTH